MKLFHISDVLTATTRRLVSSRHVDGIYDVYNFLTGDNLFTQRSYDECEDWLRSQYPALMADSPGMPELLAEMDHQIEQAHRNKALIDAAITSFVEAVRTAHGLPEMLPLHSLAEGAHTHIDPVKELKAMVGDDRVIVVVKE